MGRPQLYGEKTKVLSHKVPSSAHKRLKEMLIKECKKLVKTTARPINNLKKLKQR